MKLKRLGRSELEMLGEKAAELLKPLETEFNLKIRRAGGTFGEGTGVLRFEMSLVAEDGMVLTREAEAFKMFCKYDGLTPEHLGREVTINGKKMKLIGYKAASRLRPYLLEELGTDRRIVCPAVMIRAALGVAEI